MFLLRRAAVRSFSSPTSAFTSKPRTFVTRTPASLRSQQWQVSSFQRRFASDEASPAQATTTDETIPTKASKAEQEIKEEANSAKETAQNKAADVQEAAKDQAEKAQEKVKSTAESVQETVKNTAESVQEKTQVNAGEASSSVAETAQNVSQTIKESAAAAATAANNLTKNAASAVLGEHVAKADAGTFGSPKESKILYIGNLFFEVKAQELEREFSRFGPVANCKIVTDPKGFSKGFGYIEFENVNDAAAAIEGLNQQSFQGRRLAVQYHVRREPRNSTHQSRPTNPPSKTLFIGNMSFEMSDKDLNDAFRNIRNVIDIRVAIDRRSGQPRGFAHADFIDVASAEEAKKTLENKTIFGRQLRVDYSKDTPRGPRDSGDRY